MKVKRKCPICHTTKIKPSADYGLVCKYGHKILGVQKEEEEDTAIGVKRTTRKRKRTIIDKEIITASVKNSTFIRIVQYALKVVSRQMVQDLGFPPELEHIVRELWLVAISALNIELDNSYIFEMKEKEKNESQKTHTSDNDKSEDNPEELLDSEDEDEDDTGDTEEKVKLDDNEGEGELNPMIEEHKSSKTKKRSIQGFKIRYMDVLSFIYLACLYLRLPILPGDLVRWCKDETISYTSMQSRLPEELFKIISLQVANTMAYIPTINKVTERCSDLAKFVFKPQELTIPDYNVPLYLDRFCSQFYLPVEAYYLSLYLFKKYHLPCNLSISNGGSEKDTVPKKLMACVVCTIKLLYSLDHSTDFQNNSSIYDISTTRGEWVELIQENVKIWEKIADVDPETDTAIALRLIKDSSRAFDVITPFKAKKDLFRNFLDREKNKSNKTPEQKSSTDNPFVNPADKIISVENPAAVVKPEGRFYYMYKFGLRPSDYELVMRLACLVVGETSMNGLEVLVTMLDKVISNTKKIEDFKVDPLSARYPLYDVALKNLYGTKFFPHNFT